MHNEKMYEAGGHNRCYGMPSVLPAFAAETRAEYKEAVAPIREELKALEEEMDAVRTENKALSARFSEIRQIRKETGELIVSKDTWKKARELKARIREVRSSMDSLSIKSLRTQARAAVKEKDFDAALKAMGEAHGTEAGPPGFSQRDQRHLEADR